MKTERTNTPDRQLRQQVDAKIRKYDEAFNNNDAAAIAEFFTEDSVLVTNEGPTYGRDAIEKHFRDLFQNVRFSNHIAKLDQHSPHNIGTAGNELWGNGEWSLTLKEKTGDPRSLKGYWAEIYIHEGDAWKVRMQIWNVTPAPAETK
jgi:ketosteroid isomerase-like protein